MRKLITAGLAALVLAAAIPSHADAMGGRKGRGGGRSAKASRSSSSWSQPKASGKKKSSGGAKKGGIGATNKLPNVNVPALAGGGRRRGGASAVNSGDPSGATLKRGGTKISVDYNAQPETNTKVPKLVNGGLGGGGGGSAKHGGGGGKRHGGGKKGK